MWLGLLGLGAERWSCALVAAMAVHRRRRRGAVAVARAGRRKAAARVCEDGVLWQRGPAVVAHGGGEVERRRRDGTAAARSGSSRAAA